MVLLGLAGAIIFLCKAAMAYDPADFFVEGLEDIYPQFSQFDGVMYAGLLPIDVAPNKTRGELMFWLFVPNKPVAPDTLTVWFNGGPGCSSFVGTFFENGPVTSALYPAGYPKTRIDEPFIVNEWAWTKATNMLYVEQPAGTGFSWGPVPSSEADLSQDFYNFMVNFLDTFRFMESKQMFLFGESYAGMYVPSMAHKIHTENKIAKKKKRINLAGIALGNGWMDARVQGPAVIDYAWWHGMIDSTTRHALKATWEQCNAGSVPMQPPFHDFTTPDECNVMGAVLQAAGAGIFPDLSPNTYDVTTWDTYPVVDIGKNPNMKSTYNRFFYDPKVQKALHAPQGAAWHGCMPGAGRRLEEELPGKLLLVHDKPESVVPYVAEMLDEAGIRVLVYNGDRDMSTCAQGSEMLLDSMKWSGEATWKTAGRGLWMVKDQVAGYTKSHKGLDFVVVYNSGHLVPYNVPIPALDLVTRFVTNGTFLDIPLPSFQMPENIGNSNHFPKSIYSNLVLVIVAALGFSAGLFVSRCRHRKTGYEQIEMD